MVYLSLRKWSGQFNIPGVTGKIRRTIAAYIARDECIVVMDDGAWGLSPEARNVIHEGGPSAKVRFSRVHPELGGSTKRKISSRPKKPL